MAELRKYGVQTEVYFALRASGAERFTTSAGFVAGDVKIIQDGAAAVNTTNLPIHVGAGIYRFTLTAAEMQAARIVVVIADQDATPAWQDHAVCLETYGDAAAAHAFDLDSSTVDLAPASVDAVTDAVWDEDLSAHTTAGSAAQRLQDARAPQRNRVEVKRSSGEIIVYEDDGVTQRFKRKLTEVDDETQAVVPQ